ncbi:MAG: SLBB domain-containing protein [Burkholderiaceae bacterium]|nr:SLBB domain-containing protein [Burkholderiaceae bacterium]
MPATVRLRQAPQEAILPDRADPTLPQAASPYVPGEFERFVQRQSRDDVRRFGAELVTAAFEGRGADLSPLPPEDYLVGAGDEILITVWGSVDADLRLIVDRAGRIMIPRVGAVQVAGVRNSDLQDLVSRRMSQVFKNFQVTVGLGQLRGIRVFVTGFVVKPGTYAVSSLSTVLSTLMRAGGPSAAGSFRSIELRRGGRLLSSLDLYDLLLKGDRSADSLVQAGDVVHVGPVGIQTAVIGSVNKPVVLELKPGEGVAEALRIAGGFSAVADRTRVAVERLRDRHAERVAELKIPADLKQPLSNGDVLRAFSAVEATLPMQRQSKRVRVEGEVAHPADYVLPEGSTIADAIRAAGGVTQHAYIYATEFNRESVKATQQANYDRALRDMETDLARATAAQRVNSTEEVAQQTARISSTSQLIERLRLLRPNGRLVLRLNPGQRELPDIALEDADRIYIPARPTTVGIHGSVFNAASYLYTPDRKLGDYLQLAGGPTKGADEKSVFVIRANGEVISTRQETGWIRSDRQLLNLPALPGDTMFVPEEMNRTTFVQAAKDWTQILYQFGIGIAGIVSATR